MTIPLQRSALFLLTAGALAVTPATSRSQWPNGTVVRDTPHNLTRPARSTNPDMIGRITDYGEICTYCHTPHAGNTMRPLWNRRRPTPAYRMYTSGTINMIIDAQPTDATRACLSCHDGTVGLDATLNPPNSYRGTGPRNSTISVCEDCHRGGSPAGGIDWEGVFIDIDLRKHHPVSILYDPSRDAGFRSAAEVEASGLRLKDGKVECATCHEPHTERFKPFLRISNVGGNLCLACHRTQPGGTAHNF